MHFTSRVSLERPLATPSVVFDRWSASSPLNGARPRLTANGFTDTLAPVISLGLSGARRVLQALVLGFVAAIACSPTYTFIDEVVDHCENGAPDPDLGETDTDCGGTACPGCTYGQGCSEASDCADGQCLGSFCLEPGCENHELDGDETGVDCGGGCAGCRDGQPCLTPIDCESKSCGNDGLCASPSCSDEVRNGDELNVDCGGAFCDGCAIGDPCTEAIDCQSGLCDERTHACVLNCARGTDECDGDLDEPCETNLLASARNCGACGEVCELSHADVSCIGGACQIDACVEPWIRCNTDDEDGCEINASSDTTNCGGCGIVCPDLHGSPECVSGRCAIECDEGFGDCDEDALTGCEASVNDVDNCGRCGTKCPADGGVPNCVMGGCGVTPCDPGEGDCDGDQVCEANLADDVDNCGRCGNVCGAANGTASCVEGVCVIDECDDGWENCDDDDDDGGFMNGCETNAASDPQNCGGCGVRCDTVAHGTGTCQAGSCDLVCNAGFRDCDGRFETGCEADTTSDPDHCGGCNNTCDIPNAAVSCEDSECVLEGCLSGYEDCNNADGCETNTSNSVQHCGDCNRPCSRSGATDVSCSAGRCDPPTCDPAHDNCDGNNANGCEADVTTASACGSCGNDCGSATPTCVLTDDEYHCQARITIANAQPYPSAQVVGNTLTFNATPHAGTNRLVLLAIASDNQGSGLSGARPDSVRFGSQTMLAGPSQVGASDNYSPDLFIYYLALGDATTAESQVQVTIDASTTPAASVISLQQLLLLGARQDEPITGYDGEFLGNPEAPDPSVIGLALPVEVSGSAIYSIVSAMGMYTGSCTPNTPSSNCPAWSVSPATNLTVTETMAQSSQTVGSTNMRAFGMFINASSASLPSAGTYAPSWSIPSSSRMTHLAVAIAPARSP
jgi:hypothetical protein